MISACPADRLETIRRLWVALAALDQSRSHAPEYQRLVVAIRAEVDALAVCRPAPPVPRGTRVSGDPEA